MEAKHTTQYFHFNNPKDKHFFAGIFNTAQHNFNLSLEELGKRIGCTDTKKGLIKKAFEDNISVSDWETRIKYLSESLPFINYFEYKNRQEFRKVLCILYDTIDKYRNYYTHFNHARINIDDSLFDLLDQLLFKSALNVKRNRAKSEVYKEHLSIKYKAEFEKIINATKLKKEKNQEDEVNHVLDKVFRYFLDKNNTEKDELSEDASSKNKDGNLSTNGFVQLVALFLNKKQTESILSYKKYLKATDQLRFIVTRWTLTFLCYRDIKRLFKSDYSNDSLLLQMVSELNKCPNELYQHLSPKKKLEFLEDINEYYKDNLEYSSSLENALVSHEVLQKRNANKFAYFALRFLDEFVEFPTLKFQINLGKFNHNTSPKVFSNSIETERSLLEKITVFTKLSEATNAKVTYFKKPENRDLENGWKKFPMPSYQFNRNNIGIWLAINDNSGKSDATTKREKENKKTRYAIAKELELKDTVKKPVAYLSINEIPALLYAFLIDNKTPKYLEKIIKTKIFAQKNQLRKFGKEETNTKYIPKKLRKADAEQTTYNIEKLKRNIRTEIGKNPLDLIRKPYKRKPKNCKEFTKSEKGKIATWLADDIKRFTSKETRKNWKGYQYAEFQALLSFYDIDKNKPKLFLEKDFKYDFKKDNPFNGVKFNDKFLYKFYVSYLKKRKEYLEGLLKEITTNKKNINESVFTGFTKRIYEIKPVDQQKEILLKEVPINLPRGIFDDKPTSYDIKGKENTELATWFTASSTLENAQQFYSFEKIYERQTITVNKGLKAQYNYGLPLKNQKEIYSNEKRLRKIMREDFFVLEMAKFILGKRDISDIENIQLKNVFLTKEEKNKNQEESKKQSKKPKEDTGENIINESYILSKKITISILNGKITGDVKIKNIGKNLKLQTDQRVKQLTEYFPKKTWSFTEIIDELEDFDRIRKFEFFKAVHTLEEKIYKEAIKNNALSELLHKSNPNFKKYISYYFLDKKKEDFNKLNIENILITNTSVKTEWHNLFLLVKIRNKFSHNQFLPKVDFDYLKEIVPKQDNEKIASYLNRAFIELQKNIEQH